MITTRLERLFALSSLLFVAHGVEEYLGGFHDVAPIYRWMFAPMAGMEALQASFLVFQLCLWLALAIFSLALLGVQWQLRLMTSSGFFQIFEFRHVLIAVTTGAYYPGMVTGLVFPFCAYFFWKELLARLREAAQSQ